MKVVALVSGGKDSCYAMMKCIDYGHEIVALANLMPIDDSIDELDSHMFQTVGHQIVVSYAECMGLPLFRRKIQGSTRHQHLSYQTTPGDEVEDMFVLLNEVKQQIPSVSAVSSGAITSDYQRLRVESVCSRLGLISLAYLWKQDQSLLLQDMIIRGIVAIIIKVAALGLEPAKHLGKELVQLQPQLHVLKEKYGINVCGEGGEYETLTLDCPLFINARIVLDDFQVVLHSLDSIASVGIIHPSSFHLEYKKGSNSLRSNSGFGKVGFVHEVQGENVLKYESKCGSTAEIAPDFCISTNEKVRFSRTKRDIFSIGCWIQDSSGGLQRDLTVVLKNIESKLFECGFCWADVLYVHLYIADMNDFALANETYVRFITEKKCPFGVPSRSTIELPLVQVNLGKAYMEVLVAKDESKRVLHVQSISCWAPSCIGPYSQATLHKDILHMAGQLGLDPPTMTLCSGGPSAEIKQALENCEAVANCFNCSIANSAIHFVVYCSASLALSERAEIQQKLDSFLTSRSSDIRNGSMYETYKPISLYVIAPSLPKRALVEIKPVLYAPDDNQDAIETELQSVTCTKIPTIWGFERSTLNDACCQTYIIQSKICSTIVSITNEAASNICSETDRGSLDCRYFSSEKLVKRIVRFCIYLLDSTLLEHSFSWGDVMNLRVYFTTSLGLPAHVLSLAVKEAFDELPMLSQRVEMNEEPIFNLIPVLGSGKDASVSDLFTCELFASKL